jgi:hypothetical protein
MPNQLETEALRGELSLQQRTSKLKEQQQLKQVRINKAVEDERTRQQQVQPALQKTRAVQQQPENDTFIGDLNEITGTVLERTLEEILDFAADSGDALEKWTGLESPRFAIGNQESLADRGLPLPFTKMRVAYLSADEWKEVSAEFEKRTGESADFLQEIDIPDVDRPDSTAGMITADMLRYIAGFALTRRMLPLKSAAAGATGAGRAGINAIEAGVAATIVTDPMEENLANIMRENFPSVTPDFLQYIESDEEDLDLFNRIKTGMVDSATGLLLEPMLAGIGYLRRVKKLRREAEAVEDVASDRTVRDLDAEEAAVREEPPVEPEAVPEIQVEDIGPAGRETPEQAADALRHETESLVDSVRTKAKDTLKSQEVLDRIRSGNIATADEGIDFNFSAREWDEIAEQAETDPQGLKSLINEVSEVFEEVTETATRGVQRTEVTEALAKQMGEKVSNVEDLFADLSQGPGLAARYLSASGMLQASAARVTQLARAAVVEGASRSATLAAERAIELHGALQAQIKGSQTEIARALNAMKRVKAASQASFDDIDDAIMLLAGRDSALRESYYRKLGDERSLRGVNRLVQKSKFRRGLDMAVELYINGLLSSLSTLTLNNVSNGIKGIEEIGERYLAAGIGTMRNAVRQAGGLPAIERVSLREANAFAFGTIKGHQMSLRIPLMEILQRSREVSIREAVQEAADAGRLGNTYRALIDEQPVTDSMQRVDLDTKKAIPGYIGSIARLPGRAILTSDEHFKSVAYFQELYARSYREAARRADNANLKGRKRQRFMASEVEKLRADPPDDIHMASMDFARYQTFQTPLEKGGVSRQFEMMLTRHPMLRFVVPFYRTPVNIVKQAFLDRTVMGASMRRGRNNLLRQLKNGGPEGDLAIARVATGSAVLGMAMEWYFSGNLVGSGQSNPSIRNTQQLSGIPPYSMKIGDTWVQYNRLDPFGMVLGFAADIAEVVEHWDPDEDDGPIWTAIVAALTVTSQNITSKTWFKGVADLTAAMEQPKRKAETFIESTTTTFVTPFSSLLRRINVDHDPIAREAWSWMDKWKKNIPGFSDELPPKRDLLGKPIDKQEYVGSAWYSPVAEGRETDNPVYRELARLEFDYTMPPKDIFSIGKDVTPEQYSRFLELRGQTRLGGNPTLEESLLDVMKSSAYENQISDAGRIAVVKDIISKYGTGARAQLLKEDSDLREQVIEAKRSGALELLQPQQ